MEGVQKSSPFLSKEFFSFHFNLLKKILIAYLKFFHLLFTTNSKGDFETSLRNKHLRHDQRSAVYMDTLCTHTPRSTVILALFRHFSAEKCQSSKLIVLFHNKQAEAPLNTRRRMRNKRKKRKRLQRRKGNNEFKLKTNAIIDCLARRLR